MQPNCGRKNQGWACTRGEILSRLSLSYTSMAMNADQRKWRQRRIFAVSSGSYLLKLRVTAPSLRLTGFTYSCCAQTFRSFMSHRLNAFTWVALWSQATWSDWTRSSAPRDRLTSSCRTAWTRMSWRPPRGIDWSSAPAVRLVSCFRLVWARDISRTCLLMRCACLDKPGVVFLMANCELWRLLILQAGQATEPECLIPMGLAAGDEGQVGRTGKSVEEGEGRGDTPNTGMEATSFPGSLSASTERDPEKTRLGWRVG